MTTLPDFLIRASIPVSKLISKIGWPVHRRHVTEDDYRAYSTYLSVGDTLLSYKRLQLSNWFIPGDYSHAAIVVDVDHVVEATTKGVLLTSLMDFFTTKDRIAAYRPMFASVNQIERAASFAISQIGGDYDYEFMSDNGEWYCSELVYSCYNEALDGRSPFTLRERYGRLTALPDDIVRAKDKFNRVWRT